MAAEFGRTSAKLGNRFAAKPTLVRSPARGSNRGLVVSSPMRADQRLLNKSQLLEAGGNFLHVIPAQAGTQATTVNCLKINTFFSLGSRLRGSDGWRAALNSRSETTGLDIILPATCRGLRSAGFLGHAQQSP